jgi:hypothetical protein
VWCIFDPWLSAMLSPIVDKRRVKLFLPLVRGLCIIAFLGYMYFDWLPATNDGKGEGKNTSCTPTGCQQRMTGKVREKIIDRNK